VDRKSCRRGKKKNEVWRYWFRERSEGNEQRWKTMKK
jgi:hypothetical protein